MGPDGSINSMTRDWNIKNIGFVLQASGGTYEGEYENDIKSGKGKYTYGNGDIYDGEWKNGKKHGVGTYKYKKDEGV